MVFVFLMVGVLGIFAGGRLNEVKAQGKCICDDGRGNVIEEQSKCDRTYVPVCDIPGKKCDCLTVPEATEKQAENIAKGLGPAGVGSSLVENIPINIFCENEYEINTALGCMPVELDNFLIKYLPFLFGIFGGTSFLIMVYGFILMATSSGDPKAVQGAKETITSAITGLLVSIFAIFIIRLIILDILKFPT